MWEAGPGVWPLFFVSCYYIVNVLFDKFGTFQLDCSGNCPPLSDIKYFRPRTLGNLTRSLVHLVRLSCHSLWQHPVVLFTSLLESLRQHTSTLVTADAPGAKLLHSSNRERCPYHARKQLSLKVQAGVLLGTPYTPSSCLDSICPVGLFKCCIFYSTRPIHTRVRET